MTESVDLNADVGEGFGRWSLGDDDGLMAVITSANVACGFHAGDPTVIRATCRAAAAAGVAIGAQVSYPDLAGFGRRFVDMEPSELTDAVLYQLAALEGIARVDGTRVLYVKPHGALLCLPAAARPYGPDVFFLLQRCLPGCINPDLYERSRFRQSLPFSPTAHAPKPRRPPGKPCLAAGHGRAVRLRNNRRAAPRRQPGRS